MRAEGWERLADLFDALLELPADERIEWLETLKDEDAALRPELEEWLRQEANARGFLEAPIAPGTSWDRDSWLPCQPGARVGGYRIHRLIGFGGTSVVYEAAQEEPPRAVALKVFHTGLANERTRERFEKEAGILARLRHPSVAQVFAAGTEQVGEIRSPWIAMELVRDARPITRYARDEKLDRRGRIELFARICDGVEQGHQRGVIHRDLKPANLLVDAAGEPKVIDFGLAKETRAGMAYVTTTGGLLGTLAWMSPEQLGGEQATVDTRSDVYALGVVLYQLLCGTLPHDLESLSLQEALRVVCNEPPPRPSAIAPEIDLDLDAVVMTALAKDPGARYRTAGELAADLRRHVAREPVVARRASLFHHLRLSIARHRRISSAAVVCAVVFGGAIALSALGAARVEARERAKATAVTDFLESVLVLASPSVGQRSDLTIREVLDDAAQRIDSDLALVPEARAEIHALVGSAWRELGDLDRAEGHLQASAAVLRSTHPGSAEHAGALSMLSEVLLAGGRGQEAEEVLMEARELYEAIPDRPEFYIGIVTNKLAEARRLQADLESAEELALRALEIYRLAFGERHVAVAAALHNLASIQRDRGALAEAEESARAALAIHRDATGEGSLATAHARMALAEVLIDAGARADRAEASALLAKVLRTLERVLPEGHADRQRVETLFEESVRSPEEQSR